MMHSMLICCYEKHSTVSCFQALISGFLNFRNFHVQEYEHYEVSLI